ncbi:Hypothetical_protein [Hexamita inflata]|uniref:Hypothetical_protein n=1 Tax=Hexamita inflata TaxID=28002 RepID=A0AA86PVK6_9EUKA|nr:Hypothetical protein HINF_LOCUS34431 [Hexamita inflata]
MQIVHFRYRNHKSQIGLGKVNVIQIQREFELQNVSVARILNRKIYMLLLRLNHWQSHSKLVDRKARLNEPVYQVRNMFAIMFSDGLNQLYPLVYRKFKLVILFPIIVAMILVRVGALQANIRGGSGYSIPEIIEFRYHVHYLTAANPNIECVYIYYQEYYSIQHTVHQCINMQQMQNEAQFLGRSGAKRLISS